METKITTRVIIYKDEKVLLSRNTGCDFWYPGGGGLEENEDLIECCVREVKEETEKDIKIIDLMYIQEFYSKDNKRLLEFFFLAEPDKKLKDDQFHIDMDFNNYVKVEENKWFTKDEMQNVKVFPGFMREQFWEDIKKNDFEIKRYYKGYEGDC